MQMTEPNTFQWMVTHTTRHRRRLEPKPGPIEQLVLDSLKHQGPLSCPQLATHLSLLDPLHYEMVRNAIYRLLEKSKIHRHAVGDGSIRTRRVVWALGASKQLPHWPVCSSVKEKRPSLIHASPH